MEKTDNLNGRNTQKGDFVNKRFYSYQSVIVNMKFAEIAILLREIVDRCPGLDGATITLIPQKAMYPLYEGYHINIKANFAKETIGGLRKIVEGHDLAMQIKSDAIIVYEARST